MTSSEIDAEIESLISKIEHYKQEILIADGAIQAFRYMQAKLDPAPPVQPMGEHLDD